MKIALLLTFFVLGCMSQPTEIICYNPPSGSDVIDLPESMIQGIAKQAEDIIEMEWQDVSVEEAVNTLPTLLNHTFFTLFQQQIELDDSIAIAPIASATIKGLLNTTIGEEVMNQTLQDPLLFAQVMATVVGTFDGDCMDEPNVVLFENYNAILQSIVSIATLEQVSDIFVQTGVFTANQYNLTESWSQTLNSLDLGQLDMTGLGSFLAGIIPGDVGDVIAPILSVALDGVFQNPDGIAEAISKLIVNIQQGYDIDTAQFIPLAVDMFTQLAEQLN